MIVIGAKTATVKGFTYPIPDKWLDIQHGTGNIKCMMVTDESGDPFWNEERDEPYLFQSFLSLNKFITEFEFENVRIFVMDMVYLGAAGWQRLPVAELDYAEVSRKTGTGLSVYNFKKVIYKETTNARIQGNNGSFEFSYRFS
jgi:hypothetical protein